MTELIEWLHQEEDLKRLHPLLIIAIFIVILLAIHPFQDGNGRLNRVLTMLLLLQAGYAYMPYSSLESVIENNKESYYLALRQTQATIEREDPNWRPWLHFFLRALQLQKRSLAAKIARERVALTRLPEFSLIILEHAREHGRVTMADIILRTGASRNTLKEHFRKLMENQQIELHGSRKGAWYTL